MKGNSRILAMSNTVYYRSQCLDIYFMVTIYLGDPGGPEVLRREHT